MDHVSPLAFRGAEPARAAAQLLAEALAAWRSALAGLPTTRTPRPRPEVAIETLGGFRVLRGGVPVPYTAWQSRKARDLLKLLVARRGRPATREQLTESLWPDDDPRKTANRLSVALCRVRTVLDPERRLAADHFVVADRAVVWLDPDAVVVDVDGFLAAAEAGLVLLRQEGPEAALEPLRAAEAAYTGDFLPGDLYADWAASLREAARAAYASVARELASVVDDPEGAARLHRRILERDPYDEQANLGLVRVLAGAGAHGEARRAYRRYVRRLAEIGVRPTPFPAAVGA